MKETIVCNSSCLIALDRIKRLDILQNSFKLPVIFFLLLAISITPLHAENSLYFSPGISIGVNSDWQLIAGAKISLGINTNSELTQIAFYNITLGFNGIISSKSFSNKMEKFNYIQFQAGRTLIIDDPLIFGAGIGFIFNSGSELNYSPMLSLFSGFILFPELDLLFLRNDSMESYLKIRGVAPYVLRNLPLK